MSEAVDMYRAMKEHERLSDKENTDMNDPLSGTWYPIGTLLQVTGDGIVAVDEKLYRLDVHAPVGAITKEQQIADIVEQNKLVDLLIHGYGAFVQVNP